MSTDALLAEELRPDWRERLRRRRLELLLSQEELGRMMGTKSGHSIGRWEKGTAWPRMKSLRRLIMALDVDKSYFLRDAS
jgi:transcriptional regulator with XRE-family HTH domain